MKSDRNKKILLGALLLVMFITWYLVLDTPDFISPQNETEKKIEKKNLKGDNFIYDQSLKVLLARLKSKSYNDSIFGEIKKARFEVKNNKNIRNPFDPNRNSKKILVQGRIKRGSKYRKKMILQGIIWDISKPFSIINDEILSIGDTVQSYIIKEIKRNCVIIERKGKQKTLWIPE